MTSTRNDRHVDTLVVGGQIVSSSQVYAASIAISGEKIVAIGPENLLPRADNYIDASGMYVLPGLIDCHVHLDGHDNYAIGSLAAAHAGLTTLVPFGTYNLEGDETLPEAISRSREEIERTALTDFGFHFILQNRPSILNSLPQALDMGVKSYKMFMTYKKRPYRMCDDDFICQTMDMVAKGGGVLQLHCESGNIIEYLENKLLAEGHTHPTDFPAACPDWAEEEAINRAVHMAAATRCPTYVVHLSTQLGLERIKRRARSLLSCVSCRQQLFRSEPFPGQHFPHHPVDRGLVIRGIFFPPRLHSESAQQAQGHIDASPTSPTSLFSAELRCQRDPPTYARVSNGVSSGPDSGPSGFRRAYACWLDRTELRVVRLPSATVISRHASSVMASARSAIGRCPLRSLGLRGRPNP